MEIHVLVGTDVHERIATVAGSRRCAGLWGPDVAQYVALAGDRFVVVGAGDAVGARIAGRVAGQYGRPLVGEGEKARARQCQDLPGIDDIEQAFPSRPLRP